MSMAGSIQLRPGLTYPLNGRRGVPGYCAAELCTLALPDVQHGRIESGHWLGRLCSYRRKTRQSYTI